jgi:pyruvate/2-oxoglutarate dehydrogenase complex dihydrolipoamide dehydrogenase (E3) component
MGTEVTIVEFMPNIVPVEDEHLNKWSVHEKQV